MIGILVSTTAQDPDSQHGANLAGWLQRNAAVSGQVLAFEALTAADLRPLSGLWWHHTAGTELPRDALHPETIRLLRRYVEEGGKLFLSRGAAAFVEPLGVAAPPDRVRTAAPAFFLRPGLQVESADHPLTGHLPRRIITFGSLPLSSFCDLGWERRPDLTGTTLGVREMNGAVFRDEVLLREWRLARGRVSAFGGVALHFYDGEDPCRDHLKSLAAGIAAYLERSCLVEVVAATKQADLYEDSYLARRLGTRGLAFPIDGPIALEVRLTPFRLPDPELRLVLERGNRLVSGITPNLEERDAATLACNLVLDPEDLEEGYHDLTLTVHHQQRTVHEETVPLLITGSPKRRSRPCEVLRILEGSSSVLEIDHRTGCAKGLYPPGHPAGLNFLANETNAILAEGDPPPWFGTLLGRCREDSRDEWHPFSNRSGQVIPSRILDGEAEFFVRVPGLPMALRWGYLALEDRVRWFFRLENEGAGALEIGSLYFPASLNTYFGYHGDQEGTYRKRVMMHNLICGEGSYLFAEPLAGIPPYLLILPRFPEGFECMWHDRDRFAGRQPAWEGLLYVGIFTRAEQEALAFPPWFNGHTIAGLPAGASRTFSLDLFFVDTYDAVNDVLVREGKPAFEPHPGMVVPADHPASCRIRGRGSFRIEAPEGVDVKEEDPEGGSRRFAVAFREPGAYTLRVRSREGISRYHYRVIPPLGDLVKARGAFIAAHQQHRSPGSERDFALLMWDSETDALVTHPKHAYLAGGSDEPCLADPVFLSAKQIFLPEEREIEVLERYIEHFLFNKVQSRVDFSVRRWVAEPGIEAHAVEGHDIGSWTDRSFNYPHVFNIYYALHVTGKRYGMTRMRSQEEYLEMAARTALAYFTFGKCLNAAVEQGNLGDRALELILASLAAEGMDDLHRDLEAAMGPKVRYLTGQPYPFASEYTFDTTGYEGVYWIRRMARDGPGLKEVLDTILATRGKQPFWYHYGGDTRWGWGNSKHISPDEICFNYMCGMNARVLLDAFAAVRPEPRYLALGFAGTIAPWVLVDPDGTAHDFCGWEPGRVRFDPWSSEMGLGIAATLFALMSAVTFSGNRRPTGFGCAVKVEHGEVHIEPRDGIARRLLLVHPGRSIRLSVDTARILHARYAPGERRVTLDLEAAAPGVTACTVRVALLHGPEAPVELRAERISLDRAAATVIMDLNAGGSSPCT